MESSQEPDVYLRLFITYFEFQAEHTEEFLHLLQSLRDVNENPERAYVDAEAEIWARQII